MGFNSGFKGLISKLDGMGGQRPAPASLPPEKTRYLLYRTSGGSQGRSGRVWKISPPTGIRSPDHPVRSESLYRLRYSGPFLDRFSKNSHITFDENPSSVRRVVSWGRREGQTDRHDEANSSFFAILRTRLKNLVSYLTVNTVAITKLL